MSLKKQYKINEFFKDSVYTPSLSKFIDQFYADNKDSVFGDGFSTGIIFGSSKKDTLLSICNVDISKFKIFLKENPNIKIQGNMVSDPTNLVLINIYWKMIMSTGKMDLTKGRKILTFLAIKMFTSKYNHFNKFDINPDKMKYFINSLSNNFDIKKYGTLIEAMDNRSYNLSVNHYKKLKRTTMSDEDYVFIVKDLSTRIMGFTKKVMIPFFNTPDKFFSTDKTDTTKYSMVNDSGMIDQITEKAILKTRNDIDTQIVYMLIQDSKDKVKMVHFVESVMSPSVIANRAEEIVREIMETYTEKYTHSLNEMKKNFVLLAVNLFKTKSIGDSKVKRHIDFLSRYHFSTNADIAKGNKFLLLYYIFVLHKIIKNYK